LVSNTATVSVKFPQGTWSPLGVASPVLGAVATLASSRLYIFPTSFTYTVGVVYATRQASFAISTTGFDVLGGTIAVYASLSASDPAPAIVCTSATLETSGTAVAACTFASIGTYSVYIKTTRPAGVVQPSLICAQKVVNVSILPSWMGLLTLDAGIASSYPGTGTEWTDLSGDMNTGTLVNGPTYDSTNGGCLIFDGDNDHVYGNIKASYFRGAHTVSCWFNRTRMGHYHAVFSNNTTDAASSLLSFFGNTRILGTQAVGISSNAAVSVDLGSDHTNKWIYATIVYSGVKRNSALDIYAYKNGALLTGSGSLYWDMQASPSYYIGRYFASGYYFAGKIAHVSVYNRALTTAEVDQNYNALKGRFGL
jgi:hypothetical protein